MSNTKITIYYTKLSKIAILLHKIYRITTRNLPAHLLDKIYSHLLQETYLEYSVVARHGLSVVHRQLALRIWGLG